MLALVGRSEECQLALADNSISQQHACLVRTPLGTWVVNLGAREGVHVNGTRVRWAWLADGDLVRLGLFTMVLRYDRPPEGISRDDVPLEAGASPSGWVADDPDPTDRDRGALAVRPKASPTDLMRPGFRPPLVVAAAAPATVNRGEWEPMFAAGPGPLAMWQQQMQLMETFHRDMAMMVQMFVAMHREFQGSVRGELDRVKEAHQGAEPVERAAEPAPRAGGRRPGPGCGPLERRCGPAPRNDPPGPDAKPRTGAARPAAEPARTFAPRTKAMIPASMATPRRMPANRGHPQPAPKPASPEMYADLTRRITQLQRERRGYWERILKTISD